MEQRSLPDCPDELQSAILALLPRSNLLAISLVSRHLHSLALPLMYSSIEMEWTWNHTPRIVPLLRTLLHRPEFGRHIRRLCLGGEWAKLKEPPPFAVSDLLMEITQHRIGAMGLPNARACAGALWSGSPDAIVALLLSMAPNLTSLYLGPIFVLDTKFIGTMLRSALCDPQQDHQLPKFESLRQVTWSKRTLEGYRRKDCSTCNVLPLFYLPSIRHLSISIDNPPAFQWPAQPPAPASLQSLHVRRLRESRLAALLSPLHSLQSFEWHWHYRPDLDPGVNTKIVDLDVMGAALQQVGDTLQDMMILAETEPAHCYGDFDPPEIHFKGSLAGLSALSHLRRLQIPWAFVMGLGPSGRTLGDVVPPNLEQLTLTSDLDLQDDYLWSDGDIISIVGEEVRSGAFAASGLRQVMLPVPGSPDEMTDKIKSDLRALGAQSGIEFLCRPLREDEDGYVACDEPVAEHIWLHELHRSMYYE